MPHIGLNLKELSREELEQYTKSLEIFAAKSPNPYATILLCRDWNDMSLQKRCEWLERIPSKDSSKDAIINFLWQKIKCSQE